MAETDVGKDRLGIWKLTEYISALGRGDGGDYLQPPSQNCMLTGSNLIRAFRGVTNLEGKVGSRILFHTDQLYAGLGAANESAQGSVFSAKTLLLFIGSGQLYFNGEEITDVGASSTLSYIQKVDDAYTADNEYQAGHAQPSAPIIYAKNVPSAGKRAMSGAVSVVTWRSDDISGQPSLKSLPSNVLVLNAQSVIVQVPLPDSNGQNFWDFAGVKPSFADDGNHYLIPVSEGGQVAESVLSYTREVTGASIANTTNVVNITDPDVADRFTSADIGRRIAFSTFDSWITAINSATQVQVHDTNSSGGTISGDATVTHAVDGITRAVEISWSAGSLLDELAPDKAFPPPAGQFAGVMNDTLFLDADGIIYVGDPGFIGSFPPSNALFANEPAIHYMKIGAGLYGRFGRHTFGVLSYVGGSPALEYQVIWEHLGIMYPQNVAIGANGRLLLWLGKPAVVENGVDPDYEYAVKVLPDFEGWEHQTASSPVCPNYDPLGLYEVWCYQKKVNAKYVPKNSWCSPIDLTGKVIGDIVDCIEVDQKLYLACADETTIALYQFDVGTGSVMIIQTSDIIPNGYDCTITELMMQARADNTVHEILVELIKNYKTTEEIEIIDNEEIASGIPQQTEFPFFVIAEPNILDARSHSLKITMESAGGDAGIDGIETKGSLSGVLTV